MPTKKTNSADLNDDIHLDISANYYSSDDFHITALGNYPVDQCKLKRIKKRRTTSYWQNSKKRGETFSLSIFSATAVIFLFFLYLENNKRLLLKQVQD